MKKQMIVFFAAVAIALVSCSKEDPGNPVDVQFEFDAVGTIAEQTAEEAKKTINGKWDVAIGASTSKRNVSCSFYGVEFTNDRYALRFDINGVNPDTGENLDESIFAYGPYSLIENSEGRVTAVELYETVDGVDYKIATLTDVVVAENDSELNATFTVEFDLPDDIAEDFPCGNLDGNYAADKDEPVVSEEAGSGNTNFAKLVNVWRLDTVSIDGEEEDIAMFVAADFAGQDLCQDIYNELFDQTEISQQAEALYAEAEALSAELNASVLAQVEAIPISDNPTTEELDNFNAQIEAIYQNAAQQQNAYFENANAQVEALYNAWEEPTEAELEAAEEACEANVSQYAQSIDAAIEVTFSAYGSYIFSVSIDGETVDVEVNDWEFTNSDQTRMLVDGETTLIIDRITDTELRVIENVNETDEESGESDQYQAIWSFTRIN